MRAVIFGGAVVAVMSMAAALPAGAHHAFSAEFDANRPVHFQGTVVRVEWINRTRGYTST